MNNQLLFNGQSETILSNPGCTDENAFNYDDTATEDDGSCEAVVEGCTDETAFNLIQCKY